jgi:hypothetical protein
MTFYRLVIANLLLVSCGTARFRLNSEYVTQDKGRGKISYERSYDLGAYKWYCRLTAIFYGGSCWTYYLMPFENQADKIVADARNEIRKQLNTSNVNFIEPKIRLSSWDDEPDEVNVFSSGGVENINYKPVLKNTEQVPADEFLR